MKKILFTILAFSIAAGLLAVTTCDEHKTNRDVIKTSGSKGFVVLELFTSQGCSSCPAADDLLGSYAEKNDEHIIPIAFHVDYWNRLGWKDSFSNSHNSERQEYYNEKYLHASVYTPQLIVNGTTEMVGSNEAKVKTAIDDALNETPINTITIQNQSISNNQLQVQYIIDGTVANTTLNIAVIQHKTITKIKAGENSGATLTNYNVARNFITTPAKDSGISFIKLPVGVDVKGLSVVLFTQDIANGKITGAVRRKL